MANGGAIPLKNFGTDLTTGSIPWHVITFSLPMLLGSILQTTYSFINAIWVGQFLGTTALAALTISFPVVFMLLALGMGITMASNILVAQNYGAKNFVIVRKITDTATILVGILGLLLLICGELLAPNILHIMGTPQNVFVPATHYLRIFMLTIPFSFGIFLIRNLLQGIGDSRTPLYFLAGSLVLNAILDPILMFGWLGLPQLGLNGTAWATFIAHLVALIYLILHLRHKENPVALLQKNLSYDKTIAKLIIRIGLPPAIQQSLVAFGMFAVIGVINSFGETATAAYGVATRIDQIAFLPAMTFSMAIATLAGQNIGAHKFERVHAIFWWGNLLSLMITATISILAISAPHLLIQIFTSEPDVIAIGENYLKTVGTFYIFFSIMFISNGIINGAGHTIITTIITIAGLWLIRVPVAYLLAHYLHDVRGVWYGISLGFFISMTMSLSYYFSGRWQRPLRHKQPAQMQSELRSEPLVP